MPANGMVAIRLVFFLYIFSPAVVNSFSQNSPWLGSSFQNANVARFRRSQVTCPVMTAGSEEPERRLMGSRRIRRVKDILKDGSLDSEERLLGSRRLKAIAQTLVGGTSGVKKQPTSQIIEEDIKVEIVPETRAENKQKEPIVPSAASESVEKTIEVGASVEECFEAAAGFEEYPKWAGSVQYVKVLDKTEQGLGKTVEYAVGAFGRTLGYTLSYEFEYPR